jgi:hypothetical protein
LDTLAQCEGVDVPFVTPRPVKKRC